MIPSVTFSNQLFAFMMLFAIGVSFVGGCIWMASGKENKKAEMIAFKGGLLDQDGHEHKIL